MITFKRFIQTITETLKKLLSKYNSLSYRKKYIISNTLIIILLAFIIFKSCSNNKTKLETQTEATTTTIETTTEKKQKKPETTTINTTAETQTETTSTTTTLEVTTTTSIPETTTQTSPALNMSLNDFIATFNAKFPEIRISIDNITNETSEDGKGVFEVYMTDELGFLFTTQTNSKDSNLVGLIYMVDPGYVDTNSALLADSLCGILQIVDPSITSSESKDIFMDLLSEAGSNTDTPAEYTRNNIKYLLLYTDYIMTFGIQPL